MEGSKGVELREAVQEELARRKRRVLNGNALDALFATVPGGTLVQLFRKRGSAVEDERARIQLELIVELVCEFDEAITNLQSKAEDRGISISGLIEAAGADADEVTGLRIRHHARNVELEPGTHIKAEGERVKRVTGLDIGGE